MLPSLAIRQQGQLAEIQIPCAEAISLLRSPLGWPIFQALSMLRQEPIPPAGLLLLPSLRLVLPPAGRRAGNSGSGPSHTKGGIGMSMVTCTGAHKPFFKT